MLKAAGSTCNLDCRYCYYLDKALQYGGRQPVMSEELLELYIRQYIEANEVDTVTFAGMAANRCWRGSISTVVPWSCSGSMLVESGSSIRSKPMACWSTRRGANSSRRMNF